jgi:hypothetical protein
MHFTVQFDYQFGTGAVKIHNVPTKRFLPQKPHALETLALTAVPSGLGASQPRKTCHKISSAGVGFCHCAF